MMPPDDPDLELDSLFVSSLRESKWIIVAWVVNFTWVVGYCVLRGYRIDDAEKLITILGMPNWVFWGVFLPWIITTLFTAWFALTQMADHPLDDAGPQENSDG